MRGYEMPKVHQAINAKTLRLRDSMLVRRTSSTVVDTIKMDIVSTDVMKAIMEHVTHPLDDVDMGLKSVRPDSTK
jgi:hypothetical protein